MSCPRLPWRLLYIAVFSLIRYTEFLPCSLFPVPCSLFPLVLILIPI
ncbi:MAG: hypothetical protein F6K26_53575 [Moorea sp. SIO2I5]|nr:hypothetical protein [Moorena sp. SIO2I5]